jgi:hypothetical protein
MAIRLLSWGIWTMFAGASFGTTMSAPMVYHDLTRVAAAPDPRLAMIFALGLVAMTALSLWLRHRALPGACRSGSIAVNTTRGKISAFAYMLLSWILAAGVAYGGLICSLTARSLDWMYLPAGFGMLLLVLNFPRWTALLKAAFSNRSETVFDSRRAA